MRRALTTSAGAALLAAMAAVVAVAAIGGAQGGGEAATEGVQVHGHWMIEVRDPDGTLASRHEFENALTPLRGEFHLSGLLARTANQGNWEILLTATSSDDRPCLSSSDSPIFCLILESEGDVVVTHIDTNDGDALEDAVLLEGTLTSERDGFIDRVQTLTPEGFGAVFTDHQLADPVPVVSGQQILVTVEISFS